MSDKSTVGIYRRALQTWGATAQLDKATEECCELGAELARYQNGISGEAELAREIADAEIMIEQLRLILGDSCVDDARAEKLERLDNRLTEDENDE